MNSRKLCGCALICLGTLPATDPQQTRADEKSKQPRIVSAEAEHFFLDVVRPRSGRQSYARFEFYWTSDEGTLVRAEFETVPGHPIGGRTKVNVLRPMANTYLQEDYDCSTGRILLDCEATGSDALFVNHRDLHPDLEVAQEQISTGGDALVIDAMGEVGVVHSQTNVRRRQQIHQRFQAQQARHKDLLPQEVPNDYEGDFWWLWPGNEGDWKFRSNNPLRRRGK